MTVQDEASITFVMFTKPYIHPQSIELYLRSLDLEDKVKIPKYFRICVWDTFLAISLSPCSFSHASCAPSNNDCLSACNLAWFLFETLIKTHLMKPLPILSRHRQLLPPSIAFTPSSAGRCLCIHSVSLALEIVTDIYWCSKNMC